MTTDTADTSKKTPWREYVAGAEETLRESEALDEKLQKKYYIDHCVRKNRWTTDRPGYRVQYDANHQPREVKITPDELRKRRKGAKQGVRLHNKKQVQQLRLKSFDVRRAQGLKYDKKNPEVNPRRLAGETLKSDRSVKKAAKRALKKAQKGLEAAVGGFLEKIRGGDKE